MKEQGKGEERQQKAACIEETGDFDGRRALWTPAVMEITGGRWKDEEVEAHACATRSAERYVPPVPRSRGFKEVREEVCGRRNQAWTTADWMASMICSLEAVLESKVMGEYSRAWLTRSLSG